MQEQRITNPSVLIVIPCVNLWQKFTKNCLDSIFKQEFPSEYIIMKVLVIDNASNDETEQGCRKLAEEGKIIYQRNNVRVSCPGSWNIGFRMGKEMNMDYTFVLNNDVLLHPKCVLKIVQRMEKSDVIISSAFDMRNEVSLDKFLVLDEHIKDDRIDVDEINFSAFIIRNKDFLDKIGQADEGFAPAYFEDNDLEWRTRKAGENALNCMQAFFYHFEKQTQNSVPYGMCTGGQYMKNKKYYVQKWGGVPGREQFCRPFNNSNNSIQWTQQNQPKFVKNFNFKNSTTKINLEIPDNIIDRGFDLFILNETKLVAFTRDGKWYVKTSDCNRCGECCRGLSDTFPYTGKDGTCIYLKDNECSIEFHKPFCCISNCHDDSKLKPKKCTENFKEI